MGSVDRIYPPKPPHRFAHGHLRSDGMIYVGMEKHFTNEKGAHWRERWRNAEAWSAYRKKWIHSPSGRRARLAARKRWMASLKYKQWLQRCGWAKPSASRRSKRYNSSARGRERNISYYSRPDVRLMRRERRASRRCQERQRVPLLRSVMTAIYDTAQFVGSITGVVHHVDHVVPLSKGGLHVPWNLNVIPWHENLRKHNKLTT